MFVYVCMLMGFELVWLFMKFEWKLRKLWVLVENEIGDEFEVNWCYNFKLVVVLNVFWCLQTNVQVLGLNLGSRGSKLRFLRENWVSSRKEPAIWVPMCWWTRYSEWLLAIASCSVQQLMILALRVLRGWSGPSKPIFLMYLIVFKISKPLETSNELDWTWFCEIESYFWKMFKKTDFLKFVFLKGKRVGSGLFTVTLIYKNVLDSIHQL